MRHLLTPLTVLALLAACGRERMDSTTPRVTIDVRCSGDGVTVSVTPWIVTVPRTLGVECVLEPNADTDEIEIVPATGGKWPFRSAPPFKGGKGNPAHGRDVLPEAGGRYRYDIRLTCRSGDRGPYEVVIDPDMIIPTP